MIEGLRSREQISEREACVYIIVMPGEAEGMRKFVCQQDECLCKDRTPRGE